MREVGASLGILLHVFGPETHMTAIVGMALGKISIRTIDLIVFFPGKRAIVPPGEVELTTANFLLPTSMTVRTHDRMKS